MNVMAIPHNYCCVCTARAIRQDKPLKKKTGLLERPMLFVA
jgi:hypothetical protein